MFETLKEEVWKANRRLQEEELVTLTWGNVSALDKEAGVVAIKPSGMDYKEMTPGDIVLTDLQGNVIEGERKPSSDTPTHCYLYRHMEGIGSIVHTHSSWATIWAQSERDIPVYGTTHADYFYGDIPCTRRMEKHEIDEGYEFYTGQVIAETFQARNHHYTPGVLAAGHAPFVWGKDVSDSIRNAIVLEEVAKMAYFTTFLKEKQDTLDPNIIEKHYTRKHGENAYYGQ